MHKNFFLALILIPFSAHASTKLKPCMNQGNSYYECKKFIEKSVISQIKSDLVVRDGKNLVLKTVKNVNPDKVLIDETLQYTLDAHYPDHLISLISESGWEHSTAYIYHHKYGVYREVFNEIRFSHDGQYIVGFGADIEAGFTPNAISVYKLGDWPEMMSHFQNMKFGVTNAKFASNTEIILEIYFFKDGVNGYANGTCTLVLVNGIWQFKDLSCAKDAS